MLKVGLVGAGYWGRNLLRVFRALPDVRVCAVADEALDAARSLAPELPSYPSVGELLERESVDAVLVATPPSTHYRLARCALMAAKHCWVEKPLTLDLKEAEDLVALAEQKQVQLFVDETFLYDPLVRTAGGWIRSGRLGHVLHASFERLGQGRIRRDSDVWWNSAPHDLSILCYWFDPPLRSIEVRKFSYLQAGLADVAVGTVTLEDGMSAHIYLSWMAPQKTAIATVTGERGMLLYEGRFGQRRLELYDFSIGNPTLVKGNVVPIERFALVETVLGGPEEPLALAAQAFVESVRTGVPAPSAGVYSKRVVNMLMAGQSR